MHKKKFRNSIIISLTICIIIASIWIAIYAVSVPRNEGVSEDNTFVVTEKVDAVYIGFKTGLCLKCGDTEYYLKDGSFSKGDFEKDLGYSFDELSTMLTGKTVEICRLKHWKWAVTVTVDGVTIDNTVLTNKQCKNNRIAMIIISIVIFTCMILVEGEYIYLAYKKYIKQEKRLKRHIMRMRKKEQTKNSVE